MTTIEELYNAVLTDDAARAAFVEAAKTEDGLKAFLAERGCDATPEEVAAFLKEAQTRQGELSEAELESVAGGCNSDEACFSAISLGIWCAGTALASAIDGDMSGEDGKILCATIDSTY